MPRLSEKNKSDPLVARLVHDVEHMGSYVYSLGTQTIAHESVESALLVSELSELETLNSILERCDIREDQREEFRQYIRVLRHLLEEMSQLGDK